MYRWTKEQIDYLTELAKDVNIKYTDMVRLINQKFDLQLSLGQIMHKLEALDLHENRYHNYSKVPKNHIDYLKKYSKNHTCTQLAILLNKKFNTDYTVETVRRLVNQYNLDHVKRTITTRFYTDEQLNFIKERSKTETYRQISNDFCNEFGISLLPGSVGYVINRYGMKHNTPPRLMWTEDKTNFLKENSKIMTPEELTEAFRQEFTESASPAQIRDKLRRLGLKAVAPKRKNYVGKCVETSFNTSFKMCSLIVSMSTAMRTSRSGFIRDAVMWFINNNGEITNYIQFDSHSSENLQRKEKLYGIKIPINLYQSVQDYINKNNCTNGDVYIQSILSYCNYIESPLDKYKYAEENWV